MCTTTTPSEGIFSIDGREVLLTVGGATLQVILDVKKQAEVSSWPQSVSALTSLSDGGDLRAIDGNKPFSS